jgi:hypothetical protein
MILRDLILEVYVYLLDIFNKKRQEVLIKIELVGKKQLNMIY